MKKAVAAILMAITLAGCSILPKGGEGTPSTEEQRKKLAQAVGLVKAGNTSAAGKILAGICREKPMPGITDEALFRLSIISLRTAADKEAASEQLERLQKEFPTSAWTKTAAPLTDLLAQYEEVRNQVRSLKTTNQSLARENRELLQNIERLKELDLQLERKTRGR